MITDAISAYSLATGFPVEQIRYSNDWVISDGGATLIKWDVMILLLNDNSGKNRQNPATIISERSSSRCGVC